MVLAGKETTGYMQTKLLLSLAVVFRTIFFVYSIYATNTVASETVVLN